MLSCVGNELRRSLGTSEKSLRRGVPDGPIDDGDFMRGLTTIAAPVLDRRGAVKYCVASTLFQGQFEMEEVRELGSSTGGLALQISDFYTGR